MVAGTAGCQNTPLPTAIIGIRGEGLTKSLLIDRLEEYMEGWKFHDPNTSEVFRKANRRRTGDPEVKYFNWHLGHRFTVSVSYSGYTETNEVEIRFEEDETRGFTLQGWKEWLRFEAYVRKQFPEHDVIVKKHPWKNTPIEEVPKFAGLTQTILPDEAIAAYHQYMESK